MNKLVLDALFYGLLSTKLRTLCLGLSARQRALIECHVVGKLEVLFPVILTIAPPFDGHYFLAHWACPIKPLIVIWRFGILTFPLRCRREKIGHNLQSGVMVQILFG